MNDQLTIAEFARMFGINHEDFPKDIQEFIATTDFTYQPLGTLERDHVILEILKKLDAHQFTQVGPQREGLWLNVWQDYLQEFITSGHSLAVLSPKFMNPSHIVRLKGDYVRTHHPTFELNFFHAFRLWLFRRYLAPIDTIYEFGCGSAFNLVALAQLYPEKKLIGLDWAAPSVQLVETIAQVYGFNLIGREFNFFSVDKKLLIEENSAFLSFAALEQVGPRHEDFLNFILEKQPRLCIQMEPLAELYDQNHLVDYLALRYHQQRGYLTGYLTRLRQLESEKKIILHQVQRLRFGSLYHEAYSLIVWQPVGKI